MTNPTSNFGWQMPTPTDLVTDLPADFEVFGQAVDSSMADLKGGTTGQILSKATNTDMDFVWTSANPGDITGVTATSPLTGGGTSGDVTVGIQASSTTQSGAVQLEDSTSSTSTTKAATPNSVKSAYDLANAAIAKSTLTTAGDTLYRNATVPARLGIGTAGQVLTVNSGATAPEWKTPTAGSAFSNNGVLNSAYQVWQRGTTSAVASTSPSFMVADRWNAYRGATGSTFSRQATNDTTNLPNIQYCARFQRDLANTSTANLNLIQNFETLNSIPFSGKTVTLSFYARAGSNYSATSNLLLVWLRTGTGTDQNFLNGYTGLTDVVLTSGSATLTTGWQRFTFTGTVPTTSTELALQIQANPTGTALTNDYFEITGVQLEASSSASDFHTNQPTIATELAACQRYYWQIGGTNLYTPISTAAVAFGSTNALCVVSNPVTMRTTPTSVNFSTLRVQDNVATSAAITGVNINSSGPTFTQLGLSVASGLTQFRPYLFETFNSLSGYLGISAEL